MGFFLWLFLCAFTPVAGHKAETKAHNGVGFKVERKRVNPF